MSFSFNNFLGGISGAGAISAEIQAVSDKALFIDGTKSMAGTLSLSGNILVGASVVEVNELGVGIMPASGNVSIYAKTDKKLYIQDDTGLETELASGSGDVVGPGVAVDNAICRFNLTTGKIIKNSGVTLNNSNDLSGVNSVNLTSDSLDNTLYGFQALLSVTTGSGNSAFGDQALENNQTGDNNVAMGKFALQANTSQDDNIAIGRDAMKLMNRTSGATQNIAIGFEAMSKLQQGAINGGFNNTTVGYWGLRNLQPILSGDSSNNTAVGRLSSTLLTTGSRNSAIGELSLDSCLTGNDNIAVGYNSGGAWNGSESDNIAIGTNAFGGDNNTIRIGKTLDHINTFIMGIHGVTPGGATQTVIIDSDGELGSVASGGSGDVNGPGASVDNRITTFNSTTGKLIQDNGGVTLDSNIMTGLVEVKIDGPVSLEGNGGFHLSLKAPSVGMTAAFDLSLPPNVGVSGQVLTTNADNTTSWVTNSGGDVTGPGGSTLNAIPIYSDTTGKILLDSSVVVSNATEITGVTDLEVINTATLIGDRALDIDMAADGFGDTRAININYDVGALPVGSNTGAVLINMNNQLSTGGTLKAITVTATDSGSANIVGLDCSSGITPILSHGSTFIDTDTILNKLVNNTVALSSGGAGDIFVFILNGDTFTVGNANFYTAIQFVCDPVSGGADDPGVLPLFEYSTGAASFATFVPCDGTDQFRKSGSVTWLTSDIPSWTTDSNSEFRIRITRTRASLSKVPLFDLVQVSTKNIYSWDSNGVVRINELHLFETGDFGDVVKIKAPAALAGDYSLTLPIDDGLLNQVLTTDGNGVLSWANPSSGSGDVVGPAGGVADSRICCWNGTTGKLIKQVSPNVRIIVDDIFGVKILGLTNSGFSRNIQVGGTMTSNLAWVIPGDAGNLDDYLSTDGAATSTWKQIPLPLDYISGFIISDATVASKSITSGICRDLLDIFNIKSSITLTPSLAVSGLNGLDTGVEAISTWYAIFVIGDNTGANIAGSLFSLSSTLPSLPAGYNVKRRVGWAFNDASGDLLDYHTASRGVDRLFTWTEELSILEVLSAGTAQTYTDVDMSSLIPPTSTVGYLNVSVRAGGNNEFTSLRANGSTIALPATRITSAEQDSVTITQNAIFYMDTSTSQVIEYENSNNNDECTIWVVGYVDSI